MGFFDWFKSTPPEEEKGILKPIDTGLKERLDAYINQTFGTPYITQEEKEKAAEKVRVDAPQRQRVEEKPKLEDYKDDTQEKVEKNKEKDGPKLNPDVKYSLPMDDDLRSLSKQADNYFENVFGKGASSSLNTVPQNHRRLVANNYYAMRDLGIAGKSYVQVHTFAKHYLSLFSDDKAEQYDLDGPEFGDACLNLGFRLDSCDSINKRSSNAMENSAELNSVIADINDINELGNAILSKWRGITHWTYDSVTDQEHKGWFCIALNRLVELTKESTSH